MARGTWFDRPMRRRPAGLRELGPCPMLTVSDDFSVIFLDESGDALYNEKRGG